jgi:hypothetical protein
MRGKTVGIGLLVFGIAIQLVPVPRDNPPVESEVPASEAVRSILRSSCYDCHSNESRWPWYAYVAPVSWLVAYDVHEAREHMNFSTWERYDAKKQAKHLKEAWEEVEEGEMPLFFYLWLHPDAKLSDSDRAALHDWSRAGHDG